MTNLTIENVYTRQTAKALTKKHFWKLLGMMLIVLLVTYALMIGCTLLITSVAASTVEVSPAQTASTAASASPLAVVLSILTMVVVYLVAGGMGMGLISAMIDICRDNGHVKIRQVFSRMSKCLKAFGLMLWIEFKMLLWMLPAIALMLFTVMGFLVAGDPQTAQVTEETAPFLTVLPFLFLILMLVLIIPAAFRYMLSTYILADKPETGVFECVRQSKALMKGHKWQAFKLAVPPILLLYLFVLILGIVLGLTTALVTDGNIAVILSAIVTIVYFILALYFSLRISMGYCIFYLKRQGEMPCVPPEEEERIVCWQPGQAPQPAGEPVAAPSDEHIAGWQPTENKPDQE